MHSCELCGKPGSSRQVPLVRAVDGPVSRICYLCIKDGLDVGILDESTLVQLTAEDYVQCLTTPAEIQEGPVLWVPGQ